MRKLTSWQKIVNLARRPMGRQGKGLVDNLPMLIKQVERHRHGLEELQAALEKPLMAHRKAEAEAARQAELSAQRAADKEAAVRKALLAEAADAQAKDALDEARAAKAEAKKASAKVKVK